MSTLRIGASSQDCSLPDDGTELIWNRTDLLNPQAVDCFIRKTHEKYYAWFGKDFGGLIEGIFTDEPSYIYACQAENMRPYYEGIHQDYAGAFFPGPGSRHSGLAEWKG